KILIKNIRFNRFIFLFYSVPFFSIFYSPHEFLYNPVLESKKVPDTVVICRLDRRHCPTSLIDTDPAAFLPSTASIRAIC
ncbi:hypothetical protein LINGRAPRIM_LOCUS711, partial [Linum grandiflorum]